MSSKAQVEAMSAAHAGEKLDKANPSDLRAIAETGLVPAEVAKWLAIVHDEYDPEWGEKIEDYNADEDPYYVQHTEWYQKVVRRHATPYITKAIQNGKDRITNRFNGIIQKDNNVEGLHPVSRFLRWTTRSTPVEYVFAPMGFGKTDLSVLILEHYWKEMTAGHQEVHLATNLKSLAEEFPDDQIKYINSFPELEKWFKETDGYKRFLGDEMSHHAHAFGGNNAEVVAKLGTMIKFIRKENGGMTLIGHTGKDVAPEVRELCEIIGKEDQKTAVVYEDVENRQGVNEKQRFAKLPETKWPYDTDERSKWSWGEDEDEAKNKELWMARAYHWSKEKNAATQKEIADWFDSSQSKVSSAYNEHKDELNA